jgi:hypothetical protein
VATGRQLKEKSQENAVIRANLLKCCDAIVTLPTASKMPLILKIVAKI